MAAWSELVCRGTVTGTLLAMGCVLSGCGHQHLSASVGETMQGHESPVVVCRRVTIDEQPRLVLKVSSDVLTVGPMHVQVTRRSPRRKVLYDKDDDRTLKPFDPYELHIPVGDVAAGDAYDAFVATTCEHGKSSHAKADCSVL